MVETSQPYQHTNRLIHETSPYLLQHAHNPVDWYPWGEEALRKARQEDKPILLSIGYSACHWCHVMEHESFEDDATAALMNASFVSIKVDREERPDLDAVYMRALQAMTQQGGWPMTMFLLPDGRPFYGGTYYPPHDRKYGAHTVPGFDRILTTIASLFSEQRADLEDQATQLTEYLNSHGNFPLRKTRQPDATLPLDLLAVASQHLSADFDAVHGGFGGAPKFPHTMGLEFLLRVHVHRQHGEMTSHLLEGQVPELEVVEHSLRRMAAGGIYDQLGGGFHRYSVDSQWLVPHFEKMLYDNALFSRIYLHAYVVTKDPEYRRIVVETLDYVVREMTSPEGGFYSTQDADSEGEEGKFFLWTPEEIGQILPPDSARLFEQYYDVSPRGNFEGKNVLHVVGNVHDIARQEGLDEQEVVTLLQQSRTQLFQARKQRVKPGRDEKILTAWNGLMLRSFAEAARYLQRADYLQVARMNASFLLEHLRQDGRLLRTYKDGRARLPGYLEDYAFLSDGLLALYEASGESRWFVEARMLVDQALSLFADTEQEGFFDTGSDHEALISRPKDCMDSSTPSGNSVAVDVLLRLSAFTGETSYRDRAGAYLQAFSEMMVQYPQSFSHGLCALDFALSPVKEIALLGDPERQELRSLLAVVNSYYLPTSVLAFARADDVLAVASIPLLADRPLRDNQPTAYVCQNFVCQAPVTDSAALASLL